MKKILSLLLVVIVLLSSTALASETRTISFWYSAGGANGAVIQSLVDEFNETVGKEANIFVDGQYQGAYTASSNKLSAAITAGDRSQLPNVVQQGASTVRRLASYEEVIKFEDLLKSGKTSMTKDMFVQNFYCSSYMQGEAIGMPFASSTILLYYNKDAFVEAGLDPEAPPRTLKELGEYCAKLTKKNEDGSVERYGIVLQPDSWFMSTWLCQQRVGDGHAYFADNMDGRNGYSTHTVFKEEGTMKHFLEEYMGAYEQGQWKYLSEDDTGDFAAGKVAMFISSSSAFYSIVNAVGDKFTFGCAAVPAVDEDCLGVAAGGSSLYVLDKQNEQELADTIVFLEYLTSAETQYKWFAQTGYFPVNVATYDSPELAARIAEYPQLKAGIDQLLASEPTLQEPQLGISGFDSMLSEAIIDVIEGNATIDEAIDTLTENVDAAIEEYLSNL